MTRNGSSTAERQRRNRSGAIAEWAAAALLMAKGYRICARRFSCPAGEIDLIAFRRRRLAFIEVKRRTTLEAAHDSIGATQRARIESAADNWLARHPKYQTFDIAFDVVFVVPGRLPQHLENGL